MSLKDDYNWLCNFSKTFNKRYLTFCEIVKWSFLLHPEREDVTKFSLSADKFNDLLTPNFCPEHNLLFFHLTYFYWRGKSLKSFVIYLTLKALIYYWISYVDFKQLLRNLQVSSFYGCYHLITSISLLKYKRNLVIWLWSLLHEKINIRNSKSPCSFVLIAWFLPQPQKSIGVKLLDQW